ncbi:TetR/AcrR family transcriptional regulator [Tardiphaga sp. P9-11]|jgi:AcrR family transcriptional regulator|uniref:TetR/AcrR family transcriptional regulator n=1 Tax=Tardiphaga sp. P9-11 TaxID=2024614 RepID=UPI0011F0D4ED|nr:TetR/AcrR family transcriptional regulator [Tardiphaga sp. P9-11]KAA0074690.1 TetR/AcrR family transcriptional regulator [Tardiphaga sp. P9-11]
MNEGYERKKQPELVRRTLIDCAARLAIERGLQAVTVQAVADAAGVTKGGLFHHFPNKEKLIDAVLKDQIDKFDAAIEATLAHDGEGYGCFTRAYIIATFSMAEFAPALESTCVALLTDPVARTHWSDWLRARLQRHHATDAAPELEIVRYAADGVWLADLQQLPADLRMDRDQLRTRLIGLATE